MSTFGIDLIDANSDSVRANGRSAAECVKKRRETAPFGNKIG
jgi:hypothetical protein